MFGLIRSIVSGPKTKSSFDGDEIDLTYISDRLIAMAYPASGCEKIYRNPIDIISKFFISKHGTDFLIINVSNRKYNYKKFSDSVNDYAWPNHRPPTLTTLFIICKDMHTYLASNQNGVIAAHCNHGKGRTGTCIISFLLYTRQFLSAEQALNFYNKKRFSSDDYGVSIPCQLRYLKYVTQLLHMKAIPSKLKAYKLVSVKSKGLKGDNYYLKITNARNNERKHQKIKANADISSNIPLMADIFIQIFNNNWNIESRVARIDYHLFFLEDSENKNDQGGSKIVKFKGQQIKTSKIHHKQFQIELQFQQFCNCHKGKSSSMDLQCSCLQDRAIQEKQWMRMIKIIKESHQFSQSEMNKLTKIKEKKERMIEQ